MRAERGNVVLDIKPEEADFYLGKGYSIYEGNQLIKKAAPQSIAEYKQELKEAQERIQELEQKVAELQAKKQTKKKQ